VDSSNLQGPYANTDRAPMFVQRCRCPLYCPMHGENGPIPGDMRSPAQPWEGLEIKKPTGAGIPYTAKPTTIETVSLGPAPVGLDGVIGNGIATRPVELDNELQADWVLQPSPVTSLETYNTPPSIVPVQIANATEQLFDAGIYVSQDGENITVTGNGQTVSFGFELANCLAQEVLNTRKRIELTLPETLETTLEAAKKRLGPDMAPLVDLILKALDNQH